MVMNFNRKNLQLWATREFIDSDWNLKGNENMFLIDNLPFIKIDFTIPSYAKINKFRLFEYFEGLIQLKSFQ